MLLSIVVSFVRVQLQLPGMRGEHDRVVVPHDAERHDVHELGNDGIQLARHLDEGSRAQGLKGSRAQG